VVAAEGGQLPGVTAGVHVKGPVIMMALAHGHIGAVYPAEASAGGSEPHARRSPATCWASDSIRHHVPLFRLLGRITRRANRRPSPVDQSGAVIELSEMRQPHDRGFQGSPKPAPS
jgi:hypothetical protein